MLKHSLHFFWSFDLSVVFLCSGQDNTNNPSFAKGKTVETQIAQSYRGLTL